MEQGGDHHVQRVPKRRPPALHDGPLRTTGAAPSSLAGEDPPLLGRTVGRCGFAPRAAHQSTRRHFPIQVSSRFVYFLIWKEFQFFCEKMGKF